MGPQAKTAAIQRPQLIDFGPTDGVDAPVKHMQTTGPEAVSDCARRHP
jgi:hypothetical protein